MKSEPADERKGPDGSKRKTRQIKENVRFSSNRRRSRGRIQDQAPVHLPQGVFRKASPSSGPGLVSRRGGEMTKSCLCSWTGRINTRATGSEDPIKPRARRRGPGLRNRSTNVLLLILGVQASARGVLAPRPDGTGGTGVAEEEPDIIEQQSSGPCQSLA